MSRSWRVVGLFLCAILPAGCGGTAPSCTITANVAPAAATADHALAAPGNQVQFSAQSSVTGTCPLSPDTKGTWSTSDTTNTSIDQQGLATCLAATSTPATISNSGLVREIKGFTPATLTCH
jgi:Flp pilus assembly protein TadG